MSKVRVIVQARTDSNRLPGKALLPVAGIPSAVLVALRAATKGRDVLLATSDRKVDDLLAETASLYGVKVFRGSGDNVRSRFLSATTNLSESDIIVRLTADNLFPDGSLIEEILEYFKYHGSNYLNVGMVWQQPPYGLGVEIFRLGALRMVADKVDTPFEREHVTPALKANEGLEIAPIPYFSAQQSSLRCTMDTLEDFLRVNRVFAGMQKPVEVSWLDLIDRLVDDPDSVVSIPTDGPGLILGTAQLAAPYGSIIKVRPPEKEEAVHIVRRAIMAKVLAIDTAQAYPGAERAVGYALKGGWAEQTRIVTKLDPLSKVPADASPEFAAAVAEISVMRSLKELGYIKPMLMLHRANHLFAWNRAVWERLKELSNEGLVGNLGVSVQSVDEAKAALSCADVRLIQIPLNLLDYRWEDAGIPEIIERRPELEVHVRSVFLQGILLRGPEAWPKNTNVNPSMILDILNRLSQDLGRTSVADLCIAWVRSQPWIHGVVLGIETLDQLEKNLVLFSRPPLTIEESTSVRKMLPKVSQTLLNPALWKTVAP